MDQNIKDILSKVDHTLLKPTATWEQIRAVCEEGIEYAAASVCIPPAFVHKAADYCGGHIRICTVIGFPNGYNSTAAKAFEAADAVSEGADEIDMVINLGMVKEGRFDDVLAEIKAVRAAADTAAAEVFGDNKKIILKVIIETCLLTKEEKIELCRVVSASGADYIKTSTGFSTGGATREDIALFAANVSGGLKIKAAGGISNLDDARDMIALGAQRLGTSRIIAIVKQGQSSEGY